MPERYPAAFTIIYKNIPPIFDAFFAAARDPPARAGNARKQLNDKLLVIDFPVPPDEVNLENSAG